MEIIKLKKYHKGKVAGVDKVSSNMYHIRFTTTDGFDAKAGQFVSILCDDYTLRRPFSVATLENNEIGILLKIKGKGTEYLANLKAGDDIDFIGAMGNGFGIENKKSLLIGAGVGIAPVYYLKNQLEKQGIENELLVGFTTEKEVCEGFDFDKVCTDDASSGLPGSVINHIQNRIEEFKPEKIYACGPHIVLKLTSEIAQKYSIDCEVAMEKEMACSIGVCRGCVIRIKDENGVEKNAAVCQDGPVFKGGQIVW